MFHFPVGWGRELLWLGHRLIRSSGKETLTEANPWEAETEDRVTMGQSQCPEKMGTPGSLALLCTLFPHNLILKVSSIITQLPNSFFLLLILHPWPSDFAHVC